MTQTIADYKIIERIGESFLSESYHAKDSQGRSVAIKEVYPNLRDVLSDFSGIKKSLSTLSALRHRNIAKFLGVVEERHQLFLVQEYVEGDTLDHHVLAQLRMPWREAIMCGLQILDGLEAGNNQGFVHGALRPGNILITPTKSLKLLDYGVNVLIAKQLAKQSDNCNPLAEKIYRSPELEHGKIVPEHADDLYALSVILHQLISGDSPIVDNQATDSVVNLSPKFNKLDLPQILSQTLLKGLSQISAERCQTAGELRQALLIALRGDAPVAAEDFVSSFDQTLALPVSAVTNLSATTEPSDDNDPPLYAHVDQPTEQVFLALPAELPEVIDITAEPDTKSDAEQTQALSVSMFPQNVRAAYTETQPVAFLQRWGHAILIGLVLLAASAYVIITEFLSPVAKQEINQQPVPKTQSEQSSTQSKLDEPSTSPKEINLILPKTEEIKEDDIPQEETQQSQSNFSSLEQVPLVQTQPPVIKSAPQTPILPETVSSNTNNLSNDKPSVTKATKNLTHQTITKKKVKRPALKRKVRRQGKSENQKRTTNGEGGNNGWTIRR